MGTAPPSIKGRVVGRAAVQTMSGLSDDDWSSVQILFPIKVPAHFWRMTASAALMRQVLPDSQELADDSLARTDPVGDERHSPVPWVVHKYEHRALLLLTRHCDVHCRYCFRRELSTPGWEPTEAQLKVAVDYLCKANLSEVILSGGDPLTVSEDTLFSVIDALSGSVGAVRIHSRTVTVAPWRITPSLVAGFRARGPMSIVLHINHPDEFTPEADDAIRRLQLAGVSLHNQAVLLKGVNDDVATLKALADGLLSRGVSFYYLHQLDPVHGAGHFRVDTERGLMIMAQLRPLVSGLVFPRYVCDDGGTHAKQDISAPDQK